MAVRIIGKQIDAELYKGSNPKVKVPEGISQTSEPIDQNDARHFLKTVLKFKSISDDLAHAKASNIVAIVRQSLERSSQ